jgi:lipopolysaccharide biosynthesis glycosyltransferase
MKLIIKKLLLKLIIEFAPKIEISSKGSAGLVTIIGHKHVDMLIFSLKSFFYISKLNIPVNVFDDGTLTDNDELKIKIHIKNVRVRRRKQNEPKILKILKKYKYCLKYRKEKFKDRFYVKLFDPFLLTDYKKIIYLDYDIIFLNKPKEIITWLKSQKKYGMYATTHRNKILNEGFSSTKEWEVIERMFADKVCRGFPVDFSSGILFLHKDSYKLKRINEILKYIYRVGLEDTWTPEQYSLGVLLTEMESINLQNNYIHLRNSNLDLEKDPFSYTCLHFAFKSKENYYKIALLLAIRTYLFRK